MAEREAIIEQNLIKQLCNGESQWTYRPDIRTDYKEATSEALPKFKFNASLIREFKEILMPEISPLLE